MAKITASKMQVRVLELLGKEHDGSYDMAARLLEEMGLPKNGVPADHTPASAKKLTDEELTALLPKADTDVEVETEAERKAREKREAYERKQEAHARNMERDERLMERQKQNDALRAAGYRWVKYTEEDREAFDPEYYMKNDAWVLVDANGKPVNLEEALKAAGYYQPGFLK